MAETLLLTPRECAEYRRCSLRKLDRERADGRGPPYVHDNGRIFYRRIDIDAFIAAHLCGGEDRDTKAQSQHSGRTLLAAGAGSNGDMPEPRRARPAAQRADDRGAAAIAVALGDARREGCK